MCRAFGVHFFWPTLYMYTVLMLCCHQVHVSDRKAATIAAAVGPTAVMPVSIICVSIGPNSVRSIFTQRRYTVQHRTSRDVSLGIGCALYSCFDVIQYRCGLSLSSLYAVIFARVKKQGQDQHCMPVICLNCMPRCKLILLLMSATLHVTEFHWCACETLQNSSLSSAQCHRYC